MKKTTGAGTEEAVVKADGAEQQQGDGMAMTRHSTRSVMGPQVAAPQQVNEHGREREGHQGPEQFRGHAAHREGAGE